MTRTFDDDDDDVSMTRVVPLAEEAESPDAESTPVVPLDASDAAVDVSQVRARRASDAAGATIKAQLSSAQ